ncbi:MAG: hypothetical protein CVV64_05385 [Candidatus Wallbacteria bacterium HGW-Wallbacteria-1]|jgi:zinc transport system permease protein|uniref:Metal ABC transporter permease n=1 Tax=Candidatus Wallbacteria bacterium HGW-Wallbacteria-1 TaxID=2013854 RepID=A0A2N1PS89_9BACT|nr:MAG: hypothetical protein CVV64_05385 [Candidatus Wallbacteria bacterium HGW-Wallbacteria-1]
MDQFLIDLRELPFLWNAVAAAILASLACGVVGSYVVVRRITYIASAISHCVLGGMGAARFLDVRYGFTWFKPVYGALIAAFLAALIIGWLSIRSRDREDTAIGAVWALGMASGVLFISATPGYNQDLMSYLFGNILMVGSSDLILIGILDLFILVTVFLFHNRLTAVCFDEEFARTRGVSTHFHYTLLLLLTAITVVLLVSVVGIVMVIALLTLPVAISSRFVTRLSSMMIVSAILCCCFTLSGLVFSYGADLPPGALSIVIAGCAYFLILGLERVAEMKILRRERVSPLS